MDQSDRGEIAVSTKVVRKSGDKAKIRPPRAGMGRPAGAKNKVTRELKDMILGALEASGGVEYLTDRANDPKTAAAFLTLVGKTLPLTVKGGGEDGSHKHVVEVRFVGPNT